LSTITVFESLYMCSENRHMKKAGNEKLEMVIGNENESKKNINLYSAMFSSWTHE